VGRALRPLDRLVSALASVGSGEYTVRMANAGPPELARLAEGFNTMAERLDAAQARNLRLNEQILALQDEERVELARDLHDEVGPFLFVVNLDAASIEQAVATGRIADVPERAHAIREAVGHMQRHVRAMLHRLRPASPTENGLAPALDDLVAFWRARQPTIDFALDVSVDEDAVGDPSMAAIYRLVQEALSNAVRHARPRRIEISVRPVEDGEIIVRVADDGVGLAASDAPGLGFKGMRERVEGLNGTLQVAPGISGKGLLVTARLPRTTAEAA
jgi:two-component system, NarL family, sensor histidine kinase UhpB